MPLGSAPVKIEPLLQRSYQGVAKKRNMRMRKVGIFWRGVDGVEEGKYGDGKMIGESKVGNVIMMCGFDV